MRVGRTIVQVAGVLGDDELRALLGDLVHLDAATLAVVPAPLV